MAAFGNITAKDAAAVNVTFTGLTRATGQSPATWRALSRGTSAATQPTASMVSKRNPRGNAQKIVGKITIPVVQTIGGIDTVVGYNQFDFQTTVLDVSPETVKSDMAAYAVSLIADVQFKDAIQSGYTPG